ncbi:MAG: hypothetical protein K5877_10250 [Lachnospiraceae bacterium]|nr:hypothetical protein [Lachnospiraceae bacterium]
MKRLYLIAMILSVCSMIFMSGCQKENSTKQDVAEPVIEKIDETEQSADTSADPENTDVIEVAEEVQEDILTDDQILSAIKNYCHISNPDLKDIEDKGEYPVYWEVASSDENETVILFRSYTGALVRYYVDPATGDTYVTEFVEGITSEEERTDESFNIKDYLE